MDTSSLSMGVAGKMAEATTTLEMDMNDEEKETALDIYGKI